MKQTLVHFLVTYDPASGRVEVRAFDSAETAGQAYVAAEAEFRAETVGRSTKQVVLIAADSLATVQRTHRNFWKRHELRDLVAAVAAA